MVKDFFSAIEDRRSYYSLSKERVVPNKRIKEVIDHAVQYSPSAFNSQSARVIVLTGQSHDQLWDITKETLRNAVGDKDFAKTEEKMKSFINGYGTVLFFEDQAIIARLQEQFKTYAENFPIWSNQSSAILQFVVWTSLEIEGFGASLQHYNPLIDDEVRKTWDISRDWKLIAQMPFGKPTAEPGDKDFSPLEERVKYYQ
ncbi:nitroreductase family protein [Peribacillus simplex]|uniref:Nitroreductase family protein n=2 Tax=Peribacillus TaxID=2675229 RepID=A0AA90PH57_9BACI|nr:MULTISPECIES: nitroreductase family protein [Peribacillus]MDP1419162.1 nitroreductase family protein [Peribacillus simplex]MDP1452200.1 nitroreductase family protein [Peribacillus frigoritolerans]